MLASSSEVPRASSLAKPSLQRADYPGHERGKINIFLLGDTKMNILLLRDTVS